MPRQKSTHVDNPELVGRRLREARERAGISQRQLAFSGCTPAYISRIESGGRIPSLQLLRELGRRLGVSADYLATGAEDSGHDALLDAELALRIDELEVAEALLGEELERAVEPVSRARALAGLGELSLRAGDLDLAVTRLNEAAELAGERIVDYPTIAISLSEAHSQRGDYQSAVGVLERAAGLARSRGDAVSEARFSVLLAKALIEAGELGRAAELLQQVIGSSEDANDPEALVRHYWSQARRHVANRSFDLAASYGRRAMALVEVSENRQSVARAHQLLAHIDLERGNANDALNLLQRGLPLLECSGDRFELGLYRLEEARALLKLGRTGEARDLTLDTLATLDGAAGLIGGRAYTVIANLLAQTGDNERAIELYEASIEAMGSTPLALQAHQRLAELLEAEGRQADAFAVLKRALELQTSQRTIAKTV
jgi:tetratricopeptide (TPR) repeat protein